MRRKMKPAPAPAAPAPRVKRIAKPVQAPIAPKAAKAPRKQAAKAKEPEGPKINRFEQEKRIFNMNRDKERYALVGFENNFIRSVFTLVNMKDGKKIKISVNLRTDVSCSCMDWKIRGKKNNLNCKHILYVVSQILGLEFSITRGNIMQDWQKFSEAFFKIRINFAAIAGPEAPSPEKFMVPENKVLTAEDTCPVCYTDFMSDAKENIIHCPKCRNVVHLDCFRVWMANAAAKVCVFCRDPAIGNIF